MHNTAMSHTIENLLTLSIVLLATVYLLRRTWTTFFGKQPGGCGACSSCPAQHGSTPQVIALEALYVHADAVQNANRPRP